jgi:hypothetical protein
VVLCGHWLDSGPIVKGVTVSVTRRTMRGSFSHMDDR